MNGVAHHDLGAANHGGGVPGVKAGTSNQSGYDAHVTAPGPRGLVHRHIDEHVEPRAPAFELALVKDVFRRTGTVKDDDTAIAFTLGQDLVDGGPQRR